jgi:sulfur-oxidizing protein SoxX
LRRDENLFEEIMMKRYSTILGAIVVLGAFAMLGAPQQAQAEKSVDYTKMTADELAEHLLLKTKGFKLDQEVQEGGKARARMEQDDLQKICTPLRGKRPDTETAVKVTQMAKASIKYPEGGIKLGDWKIGRELAWSGYGYRIGHKVDDHAGDFRAFHP